MYFLTNFYDEGKIFYKSPNYYNVDPIIAKWDNQKADFFNEFSLRLQSSGSWDSFVTESIFKDISQQKSIKSSIESKIRRDDSMPKFTNSS